MTQDDVLFGYRLQLFAEAARTSVAQARRTLSEIAPCILEIERFAVRAMSGGNYGFSGEAVAALRLGPCGLDRPPAFFANTAEYHRRESLHHKVGLATVQGRGNRSSA